MKDLETQSEEYAWGILSDMVTASRCDDHKFRRVSYFTAENLAEAYEAGYNQAIKDMQSGGNKEE